MEWLKQQGPWCPGADRLPAAPPPAVRRADLLHLPLRADGARPRGRAGAQRPRVDGARRAGDPSRDLQGRLQQAGRALLSDRERAALRAAAVSPIGRCSKKSSASASTSPQQQSYPRMPAFGGRRRARADSAQRSGRVRRRPEEAVRRAEFPSHLLARGAVFRRRHRLYGPIALYGGRIDPGKGCEELIRVLQRVREGRRRRDAGADGREADGAARGAVHPLRRPPARIASGCRRSKPRRSSSVRRRTRACRCWRSRRCRSARRFSPTREARCSSSTASAATAACTTPTATSSWKR